MKLIKFIAILSIILSIYSSCQKEDDNTIGGYYIENAFFRIPIPEFLLNTQEEFSALKIPYGGDKITNDLKNYIGIGNVTAGFVETRSFGFYFTEEHNDTIYYDSDTVLVEYRNNVMFEDNLYNYAVTTSRIGAEGNEFKRVFRQHYYNLEPVKSIIIYEGNYYIYDNFYEVDSTRIIKSRLDFNSVSSGEYDKEMVFSLENSSVGSGYPIDKIKIFAGVKDNYIDISGNFNVPNSQFLTEDKGFSWSFVASGDMSNQQGVFEIGLPPCSFNSSSRIEILDDHSAYRVIAGQLIELNPSLNYNSALHYLDHMIPPYFVNRDGFVNSDTLPNDSYSTIRDRLPSLVPYNPSEIESLEVTFGE